jgi:hypothetical protein
MRGAPFSIGAAGAVAQPDLGNETMSKVWKIVVVLASSMLLFGAQVQAQPQPQPQPPSQPRGAAHFKNQGPINRTAVIRLAAEGLRGSAVGVSSTADSGREQDATKLPCRDSVVANACRRSSVLSQIVVE